MTTLALGIVLFSALLHAAWNAAAKTTRSTFIFIWLAFLLSSLGALCFAPLWWKPVPPALWPYLIASSVIHAAYIIVLGRAYRQGDYSLVYPVARGLGVALIPIGAYFAWGERLEAIGIAGIALVALGILWVALAGRAGSRDAAPKGGRGTRWALLTGILIASYSVIDSGAVQLYAPLPYIILMMLGTVICAAPFALRRPAEVKAEITHSWRQLLIFGPVSIIGYGLILYAFTLAKTGYVSAAREASIVFSTLIAVLFLHEKQAKARFAGAALIVLGVLLVAMAK